VLDNVSIYTNAEVTRIIHKARYLVRFLPLYLLDYNPIKLTFRVLKAWIKRNHMYIRKNYCNFRDFLVAAIEQSCYNRFAKKHFKHAAGGLYISNKDLERARAEIRDLF
jgi:transposase